MLVLTLQIVHLDMLARFCFLKYFIVVQNITENSLNVSTVSANIP